MSNEDSNGHLYNVPLSSDSEPGENIDKNKAIVEQENTKNDGFTGTTHSLDPDINPDEEEEKQRLITQVLELQNTLDDLSSRVDTVKEENLKLKSENQVLGQYIENLMAASSVFQSTSPKSKKK
ncbi:short coiled-coil protein B-like [Haliotis rufescens]|uniref:short coiled-coil protein B-like n=1 Tax=Haliotis rufescens TaxID=6454 RepID=UPI001EAFFF68|nr:short coiled-coil protein B-like [Haliotis rufescens]